VFVILDRQGECHREVLVHPAVVAAFTVNEGGVPGKARGPRRPAAVPSGGLPVSRPHVRSKIARCRAGAGFFRRNGAPRCSLCGVASTRLNPEKETWR
jgi:hypothetical protein